jgi:N-acetylmuramate 1-kinase
MTAPDRTSAAPPDERLALLTRWVHGPLGLAGATLAPASADASFRRYFRVTTPARTYIAMDAPPDREDVGPFLKVAGLMATTGINVPAVVAEDRGAGFLLLGDLGATQYQGALESADAAARAALYGDAAAALLQLQSRGQAAAAELPPYGLALLDREMQLFPDWFLGRHLGQAIDAATRDALELTFARLAAAALEQPQVFVHRDYHSRNLMVCEPGRPGILDFQDAVRGAVTYDLVSLYKDCYLRWPREDVLAWVEAYRVAAVQARVIPRDLDAAAFLRHFDLMGAQRHLKVLGIFARLWWRDGKPSYLHDLPRVLDYVLEVLPLYPELAPLRPLFADHVVPAFAAAQERAHAQALAMQRAARVG